MSVFVFFYYKCTCMRANLVTLMQFLVKFNTHFVHKDFRILVFISNTNLPPGVCFRGVSAHAKEIIQLNIHTRKKKEMQT